MKKNAEKVYKFKHRLSEGLIKSRPNRFIMMVEVCGRLLRCHCPSTGRIGNLRFEDVPCLLSKGEGKNRKTPYTVEAIPIAPVKNRKKSWIGINQNKVNDYIDFFLKAGQLPSIAEKGAKVEREIKLRKSRIDFHMGNTYVEVKTPLTTLPLGKSARHVKMAKFNSFDRLIRHFSDLSNAMSLGSRAIVLLCYLYNAEPFRPPPPEVSNSEIWRSAKVAMERGVEHWQVNMMIDRDGVKLLDYFKLRLL